MDLAEEDTAILSSMIPKYLLISVKPQPPLSECTLWFYDKKTQELQHKLHLWFSLYFFKASCVLKVKIFLASQM